MKLLGIHHSASDPAAALLIDGRVTAYVEEERLIRHKHANGLFPIRSIEFVLEAGGTTIEEIDAIAVAWDCRKYDDGTIARHYEAINQTYPTHEADLAYQRKHLAHFRSENQRNLIYGKLRHYYGDRNFPEIHFFDHHFSHACTAFFPSGFEHALVFTVDGRGEEVSAAWRIGKGSKLECLREIKVPHSLGWFYSAFTEYLGFDAYDGEYKVMGLAAYGEEDPTLRDKVARLLRYDGKGGFELDVMTLVRGPRRYSYYYADHLVEFLGRPPRARNEPLEAWHRNLAFAVQRRLEEIVQEMTAYWTRRTGIRTLAISGGVGLNVKMNGNLLTSGLIDDIFVYPICSDSGQAIGAPMALLYERGELQNERLRHLYYGPGFSTDTVETILRGCKIRYRRHPSIETQVARLVSEGKVVGWFQGRMEGGPRALGARSILADPRDVTSRDRVNAVIKYREMWRPFCPSMTEAGARRYYPRHTYAPFMILTFEANERAAREIPAVVHVDGTSRPQIVDPESNPRYHRLLEAFERITGVPVLLNTSFNVKGEPIVCTPQDALRTFFATGMDALAIEDCLILKEEAQPHE